MKKRTKIIILVAMVLLLGVTGYLNIALNNSSTTSQPQVTTTASYFSAYRSDRESIRDQEMLYYDSIIASTNTTDEARKAAETSRAQLVERMEQELVVEGLIKAKGFEDCVITMTGENVNAIVKAAKLTEAQVAQIVSVIQGQLKTSIENIKIIPIE